MTDSQPPIQIERVSPYWLEAVGQALCEAGCWDTTTEEQRNILAREMKFAAEMEGEATGRYCIPNPLETEIRRLKDVHARQLAEAEKIAEIWKLEGCRVAKVDPHRAYINNGDVYVSRT